MAKALQLLKSHGVTKDQLMVNVFHNRYFFKLPKTETTAIHLRQSYARRPHYSSASILRCNEGEQVLQVAQSTLGKVDWIRKVLIIDSATSYSTRRHEEQALDVMG